MHIQPVEADTHSRWPQISTTNIHDFADLEIANSISCARMSRLQDYPLLVHSHEYVYPDAMRQALIPNTDNPPDIETLASSVNGSTPGWRVSVGLTY
jgi:hypothetical protein